MCLQLVRERLANDFYRSGTAIQNDISTILANCCEYNDPQSFIVTCARRLVKQINRELVERWAVVDEHANGDWDDEDLPDEGDLGEADMEDDAFSLPTTFRVGA